VANALFEKVGTVVLLFHLKHHRPVERVGKKGCRSVADEWCVAPKVWTGSWKWFGIESQGGKDGLSTQERASD